MIANILPPASLTVYGTVKYILCSQANLKDELNEHNCIDGGQVERVHSCLTCVFSKKVAGRIRYRKRVCVCKREWGSLFWMRGEFRGRRRGQATGMSTSQGEGSVYACGQSSAHAHAQGHTNAHFIMCARTHWNKHTNTVAVHTWTKILHAAIQMWASTRSVCIQKYTFETHTHTHTDSPLCWYPVLELRWAV